MICLRRSWNLSRFLPRGRDISSHFSERTWHWFVSVQYQWLGTNGDGASTIQLTAKDTVFLFVFISSTSCPEGWPPKQCKRCDKTKVAWNCQKGEATFGGSDACPLLAARLKTTVQMGCVSNYLWKSKIFCHSWFVQPLDLTRLKMTENLRNNQRPGIQGGRADWHHSEMMRNKGTCHRDTQPSILQKMRCADEVGRWGGCRGSWGCSCRPHHWKQVCIKGFELGFTNTMKLSYSGYYFQRVWLMTWVVKSSCSKPKSLQSVGLCCFSGKVMVRS